jgi:potassium-transporting ATPase KdpC subunit
MIRRQLVTACLATVSLVVLLGIVYPLVITGISQVAFPHRANGSIVKVDGQAVGSSLIGQTFTQPKYFHSRPSAAGAGYDPRATGGTNLGPSSDKLAASVQSAVDAYRQENNLPAGAPVPVDAVTSSASGLDPDISVANARIQAARVADARGLPTDEVQKLVDTHTNHRQWGVLGEDTVNVLDLNLALDQLH